MQLTTPSVPAMAVSMAIRILRRKTHPFPPFREGDEESDETLLVVDIVFTLLNG